MKNKLYYFYSEHCWPCKKVWPIVDMLNEEWANIDKIETNSEDWYAQALKYDLMQTPSIVIEDNETKKFSVISWLQTESTIRWYVE